MTCLLVWPPLGPVLRLLGWLALCSTLSACANLQGLRDYARSSQQLAEGPGLVQRWQQSDEVLRSRQALFDAPIQPRRTPEAQALAQSQGRQVLAIQRALAAYFKTVGELAADGLPSLDPEVARLGEALDDLDPSFEVADRQALKALGRVLSQPLQGYRHRAVLQLVQSQHPSVDRLLARLQAVSALMAQDLQSEADAARVPYLQLLGQTFQPALRFLVRERMEAQRTGHDLPLREAWGRYQAALRAVRQAHARLAQVDDLAQLQAHAQALGEAIDSVRAFQSAWATVRPH